MCHNPEFFKIITQFLQTTPDAYRSAPQPDQHKNEARYGVTMYHISQIPSLSKKATEYKREYLRHLLYALTNKGSKSSQ